jgi:hypothetical protein
MDHGRMATLSMIAEEIVSEVLVVFFRIFPFYVGIVDGSCSKTLIYCGQFCNNALNYPNRPTPLKSRRK